MTKLSIVILNYNTREVLSNCLNSLDKFRGEVDTEVWVVDNASQDDSVEYVKKHFPWVKVHVNKANFGFAKGNNQARGLVNGEYILFLNSDTIMRKNTLKVSVGYIEKNADVGAVTCRTFLKSGADDKDARRSFPTPWVAFTHFSGLDKLFPKSRLFSKYWYGYIDPAKSHEIDVIQGAYFLTRESILDAVGWFSEDYFLDGEDIDLSWKIKKSGFKLVYLAEVSIVHLKKVTKKKLKGAYISRGVAAMEIFYRKRMWSAYPIYVNYLVLLGIKFIKLLRTLNRHLGI